MKNLAKIALCSSLMMAGSALTAHASSITSISTADNTAVLLERSGTFETASANTSLLAGDVVYALNGATASVALSADCSVDLQDNDVLTVEATGLQECSSMYSLAKLNADQLAQLESSDIIAGSLLLTALAGAAAIAAIVVIADDDEPASP